MNHRRFFLLAGLLVLALGFSLTGAYLFEAFKPTPPLAQPGTTPLHDSTFVFLSDTQSPLWPETIFLSEDRNEEARSKIFEEISSLNTGAVFHTGDLVALGFNQNHWKPIDAFTTELSGKGIPFFPVAGNHEYLLFGDRGISNFHSRYPFAAETGYLVRLGPLALVLLNSNIDDLPEEMIREQDHWYHETMITLEEDTLVKGIIVACHHSPFTNSEIVDPSDDVQKHFLPPYLSSRKGSLFISGHCHAVEHFKVSGMHFLVSGGGGGLQQPLLLGNDRRWIDLYEPAARKRMFHYLAATVRAEGLIVEVRMLSTDHTKFDTVYKTRIPWGGSASVGT